MRRRVLVLYCEEGEGHASAARALARALEAVGAEAVVRDAMQDGLGRLIPLVARDVYHVQTRRLRWTYGVEFVLFARVPPLRWVARRALALLGARPLRRLVGAAAPDVVVSTHPVVTNVLGVLRRRGRLRVPVVAAVTDLGVHALWAHAGIDLHLVMHERVRPAVQAVARGGRVAAVAPVVAPEFTLPRSPAAARRRLGLPLERPVVVVSGGAWGVGEVERSVEAALALEDVTVVCASGRNEALRRRVERRHADERRLRVLPFTERMPDLLAAADVLVESSLGVTCLEALACGCRVVACGAPPGHSRGNARALARLGLAERVSPNDLGPVLARLLRDPAPAPALPAAPSAAEALLAVEALPLPPRRRRRVAAAVGATAAAALVLGGWTFASPSAYPVVARAFDIETLSSVPTGAGEAAVLVLAPARRVGALAPAFAASGVRVSFAVAAVPSPAARAAVRAAGDGLLPLLDAAGATGLVHARQRLSRLCAELRLRPRFYYLAPHRLTLGDYIAARTAGGTPVTAAAVLQRGSVVVVDARRGYGREQARVLAASLSARGLRGVPLAVLLSAPRTRASGGVRARASAPAPVSSRPSTSPVSRVAETGHHS